MPFGAIAGALAGPIIGSMFGGDGGSQYQAYGGQPMYQPTGQPQVDVALQQNLGQYGTGIGQYYGSMLPYAQQAFQSQFANPYAAGLQGAATQAGQASGAMAPQYYGQMGALGAAGQQMLQTGFDPQSALYNRMQQQVGEQTGAGLSQRGLAMSPYGAGIANQANQQFNIDWQNQQLARQLQAAQGAGQAFGQTVPMGAAGINAQMGAGQLPYAAAGQIGAGQQQALQGYYGNVAPYFGAMGNLANMQANYLGLGQGASQQALAAQQQANQLASQNVYGLSSGITQAMQSVPSGAWSNMFGGGGSQPNMSGFMTDPYASMSSAYGSSFTV